MKPLILLLFSFCYILYYVLFYEPDFSFSNVNLLLIFFYSAVFVFILSVVLLFVSTGTKPKETKSINPVNKTSEPVIKLINHMKD